MKQDIALPEEHPAPHVGHDPGRPCMDLWQILVDRAEGTLAGVQDPRFRRLPWRGNPDLIGSYIGDARKRMDRVVRRLLKGETIPHDEKVFSMFERHTRWVSRGKTGVPVEPGVPVCIVEDECGFILHHRIMWEGSDVDHPFSMKRE